MIAGLGIVNPLLIAVAVAAATVAPGSLKQANNHTDTAYSITRRGQL